jgi:hypothetical protein
MIEIRILPIATPSAIAMLLNSVVANGTVPGRPA